MQGAMPDPKLDDEKRRKAEQAVVVRKKHVVFLHGSQDFEEGCRDLEDHLQGVWGFSSVRTSSISAADEAICKILDEEKEENLCLLLVAPAKLPDNGWNKISAALARREGPIVAVLLKVDEDASLTGHHHGWRGLEEKAKEADKAFLNMDIAGANRELEKSAVGLSCRSVADFIEIKHKTWASLSDLLVPTGPQHQVQDLRSWLAPPNSTNSLAKVVLIEKFECDFCTTPLQAVEVGHCACLDKLLRSGHDPDGMDGGDHTPLEDAILGATKGIKCGSKAKQKLQGQPHLYLEIAHVLIEAGATPIPPILHGESEPRRDHAPLHMAAGYKLTSLVRAMLERHPTLDVNIKRGAGKTALHRAAQHGHNECALWLLEHAKKRDASEQDPEGRAAFQRAVTVSDDEGENALHLALKRAHNSWLVNRLLGCGRVDDDPDDPELYKKYVQAVKELLVSRNNYKQTPLHIGARNPIREKFSEGKAKHETWERMREMVDLVGFDVVNTEDMDGFTILHQAALSKNRAFLEQFKDFILPVCEASTNSKRVPSLLQLAIISSSVAVVKFLLDAGVPLQDSATWTYDRSLFGIEEHLVDLGMALCQCGVMPKPKDGTTFDSTSNDFEMHVQSRLLDFYHEDKYSSLSIADVSKWKPYQMDQVRHAAELLGLQTTRTRAAGKPLIIYKPWSLILLSSQAARHKRLVTEIEGGQPSTFRDLSVEGWTTTQGSEESHCNGDLSDASSSTGEHDDNAVDGKSSFDGRATNNNDSDDNGSNDNNSNRTKTKEEEQEEPQRSPTQEQKQLPNMLTRKGRHGKFEPSSEKRTGVVLRMLDSVMGTMVEKAGDYFLHLCHVDKETLESIRKEDLDRLFQENESFAKYLAWRPISRQKRYFIEVTWTKKKTPAWLYDWGICCLKAEDQLRRLWRAGLNKQETFQVLSKKHRQALEKCAKELGFTICEPSHAIPDKRNVETVTVVSPSYELDLPPTPYTVCNGCDLVISPLKPAFQCAGGCEDFVFCSECHRKYKHGDMLNLHSEKHEFQCNKETSLTSLHLAASMQRPRCLELLFDKADKCEAAILKEMLSATTPQGDTPLHLACQRTRLWAVGKLLEAKADVEARNNKGRTPLQVSVRVPAYFREAQEERRACVAELLEHGAKPNADPDGHFEDYDALSAAVQFADLALAKLLLKHRANVDGHPDRQVSPLETAIRRRLDSNVLLLIDHGADVWMQKESKNGSSGDLPLLLAIKIERPNRIAVAAILNAMRDTKDGREAEFGAALTAALNISVARGGHFREMIQQASKKHVPCVSFSKDPAARRTTQIREQEEVVSSNGIPWCPISHQAEHCQKLRIMRPSARPMLEGIQHGLAYRHVVCISGGEKLKHAIPAAMYALGAFRAAGCHVHDMPENPTREDVEQFLKDFSEELESHREEEHILFVLVSGHGKLEHDHILLLADNGELGFIGEFVNPLLAKFPKLAIVAIVETCRKSKAPPFVVKQDEDTDSELDSSFGSSMNSGEASNDDLSEEDASSEETEAPQQKFHLGIPPDEKDLGKPGNGKVLLVWAGDPGSNIEDKLYQGLLYQFAEVLQRSSLTLKDALAMVKREVRKVDAEATRRVWIESGREGEALGAFPIKHGLCDECRKYFMRHGYLFYPGFCASKNPELCSVVALTWTAQRKFDDGQLLAMFCRRLQKKTEDIATQDPCFFLAWMLHLTPGLVNGKDFHSRFPSMPNHTNASISQQRNTPAISLAAANGDIRVLRFLIEAQADLTLEDKFHWTPLHEAAYYGKLEAVHLLLDKLEPGTYKDKENRVLSPLHLATCKGQSECLANIGRARNRLGISLKMGENFAPPLQGKKDSVHLCREAHYLQACVGRGKYSKDLAGLTPLHLAASLGRQSCVKQLLGWEEIDVMDSTRAGLSHFMAALKGCGCPHVFKSDPLPNFSSVLQVFTEEITRKPAQEWARNGPCLELHELAFFYKDTTPVASQLLDIIRTMVQGGYWDVSGRHPRGGTPLHFAARSGQWGLCQHLLELRADPTLQNDVGMTAYDEYKEHLKNRGPKNPSAVPPNFDTLMRG